MSARFAYTLVASSLLASTAHADVVRALHPNGAVKYEGTSTDGRRDGLFRFFADDGSFAYQAYYYRGVEIWRSTDPLATTPPETIETFAATYRWARVGAQRSTTARPTFSLLDRTPSVRTIGADVGLGSGGDLGTASIVRLDAFVNYELSFAGIYGQLTQSFVRATTDALLAGKSSIDVGGTSRQELGSVPTAFRLGAVFPLANDDAQGFLGSAAGSVMRPADVVASFPSSFAVRGSASVTTEWSRYHAQIDLGCDVTIGGSQLSHFDPIAHANAGIGAVLGRNFVSIETSNAIDLASPANRLHAFSLGGSHTMREWSLSGALVITTASHLSLLTSVTRAL